MRWLLFCVLLFGCGPDRAGYVREHSELPPKTASYILEGDICIGMTEEQVVASWGNPIRTTETVFLDTISQMYVYQFFYVFFHNGLVTGWHQRSSPEPTIHWYQKRY